MSENYGRAVRLFHYVLHANSSSKSDLTYEFRRGTKFVMLPPNLKVNENSV